MEGENDAGTGQYASPRASCVRRKRAPRVTSGQLDELLAILEARPYLFTKKFTGLQGRDNFETGWKELAEQLNSLPNGSVKTPEQWMTVWRDFKSRACTKAAKIKKAKVQTGNRTIATAPLTEVEKRIVSLIGVEYTRGTNCPDSMPAEDMAQIEMESGVTVREIISLPEYQCNDLEFELEGEQSSIAPQITASGSVAPAAVVQQVQEVLSQSPTVQILGSGSRAAVATPPPTIQERPKRNRNLNPRRSVAEQHNVARRDFLAVAESNAESMRMLAAASQMQAEAAKIQAEAAKTQAEASILLAQALNKVGDAMLQFINKNNK